jgi:hypothetical protein
MPLVLDAADDCGGLLALPFIDDEPGVGVQHGAFLDVATGSDNDGCFIAADDHAGPDIHARTDLDL